jgi:hypothetical protein
MPAGEQITPRAGKLPAQYWLERAENRILQRLHTKSMLSWKTSGSNADKAAVDRKRHDRCFQPRQVIGAFGV